MRLSRALVRAYSHRISTPTMKITRQTFPDALATVVAACSRASFVAIDCEMTGLATSKALMSSSIDSLDSRWARVRDSAASMGLVQFGVCPFEWDAGAGADKQGAFVARPFSFYLFPRVSPIGRESGVPGEGGDSFFVATSATLEFLRTHHFDFHDFVDGGVRAEIRDDGGIQPFDGFCARNALAFVVWIEKDSSITVEKVS